MFPGPKLEEEEPSDKRQPKNTYLKIEGKLNILTLLSIFSSTYMSS